MKKFFLIIFIFFVIIMNAFNLEYENNNNVIIFEKNTNLIVKSSFSKTIHKIIINKNFEEKTIKVKRGIISEIKTKDNIITIKTLIPTTINIENNKVYFPSSKLLNVDKVYFEKIKLKDLFKIFTDYMNWNWIKTDIIPDKDISISTKEFRIEDFIRILKNIYSINTIFFNKNTVILSKKILDMQDTMPLIINSKQLIKNENENKIKYLIIDKNITIIPLKKLFNIKVVELKNNYVVKIEYKDIESFFYILNNLKKHNETNIKNTITNESTTIILSSKYDLKNITNFYGLNCVKSNDVFIINGKTNDINNFLKLEEKLKKLEKSKKTIKEKVKNIEKKEEKDKILNKLLIIPSKINNIFDKILLKENIKFEKIENNIYIIKYTKDKEEILKQIIQTLKVDTLNGNVSLKKLINYLAKMEKINTICDFKDIEVSVNDYDLTFNNILKCSISKGILYNYIDKNTIRFFQDKKLLKYRIYVLTGNNIKSISTKDLYLMAKMNFSNLKDTKSEFFLISNPIIYVNENETSEMNSVLSVPIMDTENKVISKIESGFKLNIIGKLDRITNMIETKINLSISEMKDQDKNIVDERSIKTILKTTNGGFIKIGSMSFEKSINKKIGIPFLKDIPAIGILFSTNELTNTKFDMIILLNVQAMNKPEE
ncbi:hypothetical protein OSSY52_05250 [Tepiditoga spiralis]|uniref:Type II/III secretion system secretin-like domain-containing protein n=1 Tax=Tepiditoga spiralis TaxID=2108365 RepID=A0A7G1G5Q9_9BACT|nr:hypothetical protein [Tepiditoga spiralis]BBE30384.1 hypothetical protein OSSY52_05250 [Tepiditoga spiralis]